MLSRCWINYSPSARLSKGKKEVHVRVVVVGGMKAPSILAYCVAGSRGQAAIHWQMAEGTRYNNPQHLQFKVLLWKVT